MSLPAGPGFQAWLAWHWWQPAPTWLAILLMPLARLHGWLLLRRRRAQAAAAAAANPVPVPVLVVGNLIVGGAGKTPVVIALVQALLAAGHRPGIVSRGYGRRAAGSASADIQAVASDSSAGQVGDEPLLLQRRTGVPVWVGRDRAAAAAALCARHPEVDVLVSDDGLQHHMLKRQAELVVFDERGVGNGLLLPAGPLREPLPQSLPALARVLYSAGRPSTRLPGVLAQRSITRAWPLAAWHRADAAAAVNLASLQGRPLLACAGLAAPEKFFTMLQAAGLSITRRPLPDHHAWHTLPWPQGTADVVITEKDAVKLAPQRAGPTRVWVVPLDLALPAGLVSELSALLFSEHRP